MKMGIRRIVNPFVDRGVREWLSRHDRTSSNRGGRSRKEGWMGWQSKGQLREGS